MIRRINYVLQEVLNIPNIGLANVKDLTKNLYIFGNRGWVAHPPTIKSKKWFKQKNAGNPTSMVLSLASCKNSVKSIHLLQSPPSRKYKYDTYRYTRNGCYEDTMENIDSTTKLQVWLCSGVLETPEQPMAVTVSVSRVDIQLQAE